MAFQAEEILKLADHPFDDLSLYSRPSPIGLRSFPRSVVLWGSRRHFSIDLRQLRSHSTGQKPLSSRR